MLTILSDPSMQRRFFWPLLCAGLMLATLLPIGIHTLMLDDLGIAYPSALPHKGWAVVPDHALIVFGMICLCKTLLRARQRTTLGRAAFVFFAVAAINQSLFRNPIMRNIVSTKWTIYPFIDNLPNVLRFAAITFLVLLCIRWMTTTALKVGFSFLIAVAIEFVVNPLLNLGFAGVIAANSSKEGDQLYNVPYDWHVDLPSYLTYIEPAMGAIAVAFIMRHFKVSPSGIALVIFALQGGPLFRLGFNLFYASTSWGAALLSEGQFTLEAMCLAILAAVTAVLLSRN
jgi:hypothetical protein